MSRRYSWLCNSLACQAVTPQDLGSGLSIKPEILWGKDQNSIMQRAVLFSWCLDGPMDLSTEGKKKKSHFHREKRLPIVTMWMKVLSKKGDISSYLAEMWVLWELEPVSESITTHCLRKGYLWARRNISCIHTFFHTSAVTVSRCMAKKSTFELPSVANSSHCKHGSWLEGCFHAYIEAK